MRFSWLTIVSLITIEADAGRAKHVSKKLSMLVCVLGEASIDNLQSRLHDANRFGIRSNALRGWDDGWYRKREEQVGSLNNL